METKIIDPSIYIVYKLTERQIRAGPVFSTRVQVHFHSLQTDPKKVERIRKKNGWSAVRIDKDYQGGFGGYLDV